MEKKTRNPQALMLLIKEYESVGFFNRSSQLSWELFPQDRWMKGLDDEDGKSYWRSTYPNVYEKEVIQNSSDFQIPPSWIWAIMRAESNYNKDVVSPAGALGLMQVMPQTGMKLAKLLKNDQFLPQQLLLPEISIKIGTRYLQKLSKDYPQNLALVAAGYNAGPHRVNLWTYLFGALDLDEFVERIPFLETRNYVKKVIANQVIYSQLYKSSTKEDLSYLCEPLKVRWKEAPPNKELWD